MNERIWARRTEWPLTLVALLFLAAYAWPILDPTLARSMRQLCKVVVYGSWLLFAVDYGGRLVLAPDRRRFVRANVLDLLSIVLPVLRPLRLLRLVVLVRILNRKATVTLQGRVAMYVVTSLALIVFVAAVAELDAERGHPGASINDFGDALWWAATTITTVGYGDRYPVTGQGRWIAVGLMLAGIALIGVVTASIASWLVTSVRAGEQDAESELRADLRALRAEIADLRVLLTRPEKPADDTGGSPRAAHGTPLEHHPPRL